MHIVRGLRNLHRPPPLPVVTLGNFDGVHCGHQEIFRRIVTRARKIGGTSVVYTFDPHPLKILAPEQNLSLLTTFHKKMDLIAAAGVELTICADFNRTFARMHPRDFATTLHNYLRMDSVFVGHDYSFGKSKAGTIAYLKRLGGELGFDVEIVAAVEIDRERVSSSGIRVRLDNGDVRGAASLLGRNYSIAGKVVSGYQRGRAIGFPTANLDTPYEVIPAVGVYAAFVKLGDEPLHPGVVNIGYNPTFERDDFILEVHLLDSEKNIYGVEIEVMFIERLRDEKKFDSADELKVQISNDITQAKKLLSEA